MNGRQPQPSSFRTIVGLLLKLYPKSFRQQCRDLFVEAAFHRWDVEFLTAQNARRATWRTIVVLLRDTLYAAPKHWLGHYARRPTWPALTGSLLFKVPSQFLRDVRFAFRNLTRRPAFSLFVMTTLGAGIGVSTAVYGILDRAILRPLPYPNGDRLAYIALEDLQRGWHFGPPWTAVQRWKQGAQTIEDLEVYLHTSNVRTGHGPADVLATTAITGGLPTMLGVAPVAGRMLGISDGVAGSAPVVMLSESYWSTAFGADPNVVGTTIRLNDSLMTIAGVWPDAARLDPQGPPNLFRILPNVNAIPPGNFARVLALVRPNVDLRDIQEELGSLIKGLEGLPDNTVPSVQPPYGILSEQYVQGLWLVFAGGMVLMVAAVANASNLILGRLWARRLELSIRMALGGSFWRVLRLLLAETTLLTVGGLLVGVAVAAGVGSVLTIFDSSRLIPSDSTRLHEAARWFGLALASFAALTCSVVPTLQLRTEAMRGLVVRSSASRAQTRGSFTRSALVTVQIALAMFLLTGATILTKSLINVLQLDVGFDVNRVATFSLRAPARYDTDEARQVFKGIVEDELGGIPGVESVATASNPPLTFSLTRRAPIVDGEPLQDARDTDYFQTNSVSPDYFSMMGIPILAGRSFRSNEEHNVAIINDAFAGTFSGNVLGRTLRRHAADSIGATIVGVVGSVRSFNLSSAPGQQVQIYFPYRGTSDFARFILRTSGSPSDALVTARNVIAERYADVPVLSATTALQLFRDQTSRTRFLALLLGIFALLGVTLAVTGVYGVVSFEVSRRRHEVGIRMAIGANARQVISHVLSQGMRPVGVGAGIGVVGALVGGPLIESVLFNVSARDPLSMTAGVALLAGAATFACAIPAFRAGRVDPSEAMRPD